MTDLPLSKYLDPADYAQLTEELVVVDRHFMTASEQHPARRWEYAMALRALSMWRAARGAGAYSGADVGGAGSPFRRMPDLSEVVVIDPVEGDTLAEELESRTRLFHAVFCLSVLEHVEDLDQFLYHLSCLTAPGGLLFLTFDACECLTHVATTDPHHFHWMRKRIFTLQARTNLTATLCVEHHFRPFGELAYQPYPGPQVYNYTFASLALIKRS